MRGQAPFRPFTLGDVAHDSSEQTVSVQLHFAHGQIRGKRTAVLALPDDLAADADDLALAAGQVTGQKIVVLVAPRWRHQDVDVATHDFVGSVPEQPLGSGIERADDAALVDRDDAVDGSVDDGARSGFAVAKRGLTLCKFLTVGAQLLRQLAQAR